MPGFIVAGLYMPPTTVLGPLQVPPVAGVPPNWSKRLCAAALVQMAKVPLLPAFGAAVMFTVTLAETGPQPPNPGTVYTYTPAGCVAGSKFGPTAAPFDCRVQLPLLSGFPPKLEISGTGAELLHRFSVPLVPAFGLLGVKPTVTVALAFVQALPTVYV